MKEIDLKQIKSMEELKEELGNKYDEIMYKMNLELLDRMDRAIEYIENSMSGSLSLNEEYEVVSMNKKQILSILKGEDKE